MTRSFAVHARGRQDRLFSVIADGGVPRIAADVVPRARLTDALDRLLPLTVLRAPRGFGKTTLVAQWFSTVTVPSRAWVSVEQPGTGAEEFWWAVVEALGHRDETGAPPRDQLRDVLSGPGQRVIVVVDDLDRVDDPDVGAGLIAMLRRYPRMHLLATMRSDVLPSDSWLDLDGQVLGPDDLAFSGTETEQVLDLLGAAERDRELAHGQLGGWPIAVRAFGLARARSEASEPAAVTLRTVRDQLSATVLDMVADPSTADLVLPTAVIGDFTAAELGVLLDLAEPQRLVERLVEVGLVSTGAGTGQRYSWPGLVRDAILEKHHDADRARVREIRRDLATRYVELDEDGRAMAHARAAEDWDWLRRHVENRWTHVLLRHYDQVGELVKAAPPGALGDSVLVQGMRAFFLPDVFRIETLTSYLPDDPEEISELVDAFEPPVLYDRVTTVVAVLRLLGAVEESTKAAIRARAIGKVCFERRPDDLVAPGASLSLQCGLTWLHAGDLGRAISEFQRSHHYGRHSIIGHVLRDSASKLALVHAVLGDHPQSRLWAGRAEAAPLPDTWATPFIESARVAARALNASSVLDRRAAVDAREELGVLHPREELWSLVAYARARVALFWGHPAAALRELDVLQEGGIPPVSHFTGDLVLAARVDLSMRLGLGSRCAALLDEAASTGPFVQVRRARLALLAGDAESAVDLAVSAGQHAKASPATDVEALVVEAAARGRLGDPLAGRRLGEALAVAGRRVDAFSLVPRADLVALSAEVPGADALLADPRLTLLGEVFPEELTVIALTERERVVLHHLAQGITLQAIAHRETVSINTVKTQVRSLYGKLGATDREQALGIAAHEGLL